MILIKSRIQKVAITNMLESKIDKICTGETQIINKMKVKFCRNGNINFSITKEKITLILPLDLSLSKGEGIFRAEVNGIIMLPIHVDYTIKDRLVFETKTSLHEYKWVQGPFMEVGSLDIPIEKVADLVINYYKDDLTDAINKQIQDLINNAIHNLIEPKKLLSVANKYLPEGLKVDLTIEEILMEAPSTEEGFVNFNGLIKPSLYISSQNIKNAIDSEKILFKWVEKASLNTLGYVRATLDYPFLKTMLKKYLNGMEIGGKKLNIHQFEIVKNADQIVVSMYIDSPIKGKAINTFKPIYNESLGQLEIAEFTCMVKPDSLIFKLGAPIINKVIIDRVKDISPISINKIIESQLYILKNLTTTFNGLEIQPEVKLVVVDEMVFDKNDVAIKIRYENAIININSEKLVT